ncbi:hypothetical protein AYM40_37565 (plasmid) [Paraburkholderia phytofirmans OLGA172]|uniref:Uncharacterized protein n=1 Tax=Paraburkholderia phytofirmans OLGA172 TaxID=1417228 RepID=A0A167WRB3_9BURK|nr:hypothetical protein AYM40_37565 [Paraburkholderia phytofirmans OLGA172]
MIACRLISQIVARGSITHLSQMVRFEALGAIVLRGNHHGRRIALADAQIAFKCLFLAHHAVGPTRTFGNDETRGLTCRAYYPSTHEGQRGSMMRAAFLSLYDGASV